MVATPGRPGSFAPPLPLPEGDTAAALDRPSRRDALPEHTRYVDTGCTLHPNCLNCPLVRCRYDEPGGARKLISDERDRTILRLHSEAGLPIRAIALRFGISRRTVFRVLARSRTAGAAFERSDHGD